MLRLSKAYIMVMNFLLSEVAKYVNVQIFLLSYIADILYINQLWHSVLLTSKYNIISNQKNLFT